VGEAAGVASLGAPAGWIESHDVPRDVLASAVHWLKKGGHDYPPVLNTVGWCRLTLSKPR